jgi:hypothetical protein
MFSMVIENCEIDIAVSCWLVAVVGRRRPSDEKDPLLYFKLYQVRRKIYGRPGIDD